MFKCSSVKEESVEGKVLDVEGSALVKRKRTLEKVVGVEEGALLKRKSALRESIGFGSESAVWGSVNTLNISLQIFSV